MTTALARLAASADRSAEAAAESRAATGVGTTDDFATSAIAFPPLVGPPRQLTKQPVPSGPCGRRSRGFRHCLPSHVLARPIRPGSSRHAISDLPARLTSAPVIPTGAREGIF